jgi:hypothetical protein
LDNCRYSGNGTQVRFAVRSQETRVSVRARVDEVVQKRIHALFSLVVMLFKDPLLSDQLTYLASNSMIVSDEIEYDGK